MWHFVHISTLKKNVRRTKAYPLHPQGNFNARRERIDLASKKSHIFKKKSFGSQEKAIPAALLRVRQSPHSQP